MRARLVTAVLAAAVCLLVGPGAPAFFSRVDSARYVGGTGDVAKLRLACETETVHIGGACFTVQRVDVLAEVSVSDESGHLIAWRYELLWPDGTREVYVPLVCENVIQFELPEYFFGTLVVTTLSAAHVTGCGVVEYGPATSGLIAAGFYQEEDLE